MGKKKEDWQIEASGLGISFTSGTTVAQLKKMIETKKAEVEAKRKMVEKVEVEKVEESKNVPSPVVEEPIEENPGEDEEPSKTGSGEGKEVPETLSPMQAGSRRKRRQMRE